MHYKTKIKLDTINRYIQANYKNWVKEYPNIIGAYPGEKFTDDTPTGKYSIVFLVTKKIKDPLEKNSQEFYFRNPWHWEEENTYGYHYMQKN